MARVMFKRGINVRRVVSKVAITVIVLYAGGTVLTQLGNVMNCTYSPFYQGLSLIGWTVADVVSNGTTWTGACQAATWPDTAGTYTSVITEVNGSGILAVVGIIAIASVILEFVTFRL